MTSLELRGVRVHNLKGVDAAIPLGRLTVVVGPSGAGKSSLVFDALHAEAQRRYLQSFSVASRQLLERFDQPDADWIGDLPPSIAVRSTDAWRRRDTIVADAANLTDPLTELFARSGVPVCGGCGQSVRPHSSADVVRELLSLSPDARLTIGFPDRPADDESPSQWLERLREEGWVRVRIGQTVHRLDGAAPVELSGEAIVLIDRVEIGKTTDERLFESIETGFRRGGGRLIAIGDSGDMRFDRRWRCPRCDVGVATPEARLFDARDPIGACRACRGAGKNGDATCPACGGRRFNDVALSVRWRGRSIADVLSLAIRDLLALANAAAADDSDLAQRSALANVVGRLSALVDLDLGHLPADRDLAAISSGEAQRLRLDRAFAADLADALYLFDEPSAGLHPGEVDRIAQHLVALRDRGNTVVAIDHHPSILRAADDIVELGPGGGDEGGTILYQGPAKSFPSIRPNAPSTPRRPQGELRFAGVNVPPLRDVDATIPLGVLCVVAGISGSGKTRLLRDAVYPALVRATREGGPDSGLRVQGAAAIDDVLLFDQPTPARSARSNPATSLKIFDDIRELFAETTDAKIRNFDAGTFSFNQPGGRCETCEGQGRLTVDMQFLSDVTAACPECLGRRYRKEILDVKVRGLDIAQTLELTARDAFRAFRAQRSLEKKLKWMLDVGLDYVRLGQPLDALSTGELQRLKLAGHLAASRKPRTLLILIEPFRGLHPGDVAALLGCFGQLIAAGHSLVVEDQNPDALRGADWLIELGPEAGGGRIVAAGTPDHVASCETPTGRFLRGTP